MLPPQKNDYRTYLIGIIEKLHRNKATSLNIHEGNYVYLLRELFESLPEANVNRRWTTEELCKQLPGRYEKLPAPRMIALALRELGFTEHRDWTKAGRNRRYWKPTFFKFKD